MENGPPLGREADRILETLIKPEQTHRTLGDPEAKGPNTHALSPLGKRQAMLRAVSTGNCPNQTRTMNTPPSHPSQIVYNIL